MHNAVVFRYFLAIELDVFYGLVFVSCIYCVVSDDKDYVIFAIVMTVSFIGERSHCFKSKVIFYRFNLLNGRVKNGYF